MEFVSPRIPDDTFENIQHHTSPTSLLKQQDDSYHHTHLHRIPAYPYNPSNPTRYQQNQKPNWKYIGPNIVGKPKDLYLSDFKGFTSVVSARVSPNSPKRKKMKPNLPKQLQRRKSQDEIFDENVIANIPSSKNVSFDSVDSLNALLESGDKREDDSLLTAEKNEAPLQNPSAQSDISKVKEKEKCSECVECPGDPWVVLDNNFDFLLNHGYEITIIQAIRPYIQQRRLHPSFDYVYGRMKKRVSAEWRATEPAGIYHACKLVLAAYDKIKRSCDC